jgi:hypothetical protein
VETLATLDATRDTGLGGGGAKSEGDFAPSLRVSVQAAAPSAPVVSRFEPEKGQFFALQSQATPGQILAMAPSAAL